MKNEEKKEIAKAFFDEIVKACEILDIDFFKLSPQMVDLLVQVYSLGFIRGIKEVREGEKDED